MKKNIIIFIIGLVAGILDLIPLIFVQAPLFNMLSIIAFWVSATIFIANTILLKSHILNGLLIATILMLPMALAVSASNPKDFFPMMFMAIVLGPIVGFSTNKFIKE